MFFELFTQDTQRKTCAKDGNIKLPQKEWHGPDMIFVTMGEDDGFYAFSVASEISKIGNDQIHSRHVVVGKHEAHIHHQNGFFMLDGHHIQPDFSQTS